MDRLNLWNRTARRSKKLLPGFIALMLLASLILSASVSDVKALQVGVPLD